jgi:ubiquinone/menaquinone biosynthesis C-methylase UbiE
MMRAIKEDIRHLVEAGLGRGMNVVEFGCATGSFTREIARAVGPAGRVHGVDYSAFSVARARELSAQEGLENVTFDVADEKATTLATDFADLCVARHVLAQTPRPEEVVKEMSRVARPGGIVATFEADEGLVIYEPEPPALHELRDLLARNRLSTGGTWMTGRRLYRLLRDAGLERVRIVARTANSTEFERSPGHERMSHTAGMSRAVEALADKGDLTRDEASRYLRALEEAAGDPLSFIFVCDFFAFARKPLRCA